jgi:uncharacterized OB-fold protein
MKKGLALVLVLGMMVSVFAGCAPKDEGTVDVKLGLGSVTSTAKSRDADVDSETAARAQADTTIAAVAFDKDGKIVAVSIDVAQVQINFDADMKVASDKEAPILTKKELGPKYGMIGRSEIGKEWYEQIAALEDWMIGKTIEEVKALKVKERDAAHTHVPDVPELTSSVTITVQDYLAAVEKAWNNTIEVKGFNTLGLGHTISIAKSKDATDTNTAQAQADITFAAAGFDKDGKVAGTIIDTAQVKVAFDAEGKVVPAADAFRTKKELGDDYGMKGRSEIGKEWFEQLAAFEEWMVGKTMLEIKNLNLKDNAPDIPELTSSVTVVVNSYIDAVFEAYRFKK